MKMFRKVLEKFGRGSKEFEKSLKTDVEDRITDEIWAIHLNLMEKFNSTQPKDEMITPTEEKPLKESSGAKELREQLDFTAQINKSFKKSSPISVEDAYLKNFNKVWEACNQAKQEEDKLDQDKQGSTGKIYKPIVPKNLTTYPYYFAKVPNFTHIDIYHISEMFKLNSYQHHGVKKLIAAGNRGSKDRIKDLQEVIATLEAWIEFIKSEEV